MTPTFIWAQAGVRTAASNAAAPIKMRNFMIASLCRNAANLAQALG
jgi:hypothetical protein